MNGDSRVLNAMDRSNCNMELFPAEMLIQDTNAANPLSTLDACTIDHKVYTIQNLPTIDDNLGKLRWTCCRLPEFGLVTLSVYVETLESWW